MHVPRPRAVQANGNGCRYLPTLRASAGPRSRCMQTMPASGARKTSHAKAGGWSSGVLVPQQDAPVVADGEETDRTCSPPRHVDPHVMSCSSYPANVPSLAVLAMDEGRLFTAVHGTSGAATATTSFPRPRRGRTSPVDAAEACVSGSTASTTGRSSPDSSSAPMRSRCSWPMPRGHRVSPALVRAVRLSRVQPLQTAGREGERLFRLGV